MSRVDEAMRRAAARRQAGVDALADVAPVRDSDASALHVDANQFVQEVALRTDSVGDRDAFPADPTEQDVASLIATEPSALQVDADTMRLTSAMASPE